MSSYRIERLIGIGGAAVVYEARPLLPDGDGAAVACKLLRAEQRADADARALMRREAALGLRITPCHPGLARFLDCFEDGEGRLCIVMEHVDGGSLKALLGSGGRLPFPCTRRIVWEVLQALDCLHGLDVLHRDLSPCNILMSTGGSVKVTDLGIARVMEQGQFFTRNYRGKLAYDSPEAIQTQALDVRSDLYALGAVLYELLAGTPPCGETEEWASVVMRTLRGDFAPLPPDAPADLAGLAMGLLQTDRDDREPASAAEALLRLSDHGQPMASTAELAALVTARMSRRDGQPDDAHRAPTLSPEDLLAPGHVLVARAAGIESATPEAGTAPEPAQAPVFPLPALPPLPPLPQEPPVQQRSQQRAQQSDPQGHSRRCSSGAQRAQPSQAPRPRGRVTAALPGSLRPRRRATGRVLLVAFILVSGFLLGDRFRGERDAGTVQPPAPPVPVPVLVQQPAVPALARVAERAPSPDTPERAAPAADLVANLAAGQPSERAAPAADLAANLAAGQPPERAAPEDPRAGRPADRNRGQVADGSPERSRKQPPPRSARPERRWRTVVRRSERSAWAIP